jgi:hypothetical protein
VVAVGLSQLHQRRQETRERFARAGRRDQQRRVAGLRGGEQIELVPARRPSACSEPAQEDVGQKLCRGLMGGDRHSAELTPSLVACHAAL